ncbi:MAG: hypothetical protein WCI77_01045 [Candidatus Omnitrophota bacterium]
MAEETLEERCRKAVLKISQDVNEIKYLLGHMIETEKDSYYALSDLSYQKVLKDYPK